MKNPTSDKGYLDLSEVDLDNNMAGLNGYWEFYPEEFKNTDFKPLQYIHVPGVWNNKIYNNKPIKENFYATCRLKIKLPKKGLYCLKTRNIANAFDIIVNGTYIGSKGQISTNKNDEVATWEDKMFPFYSEDNEIEVIIHVSSHQYTAIGIIDSIALGSYNSVSQNNLKNIIKSALIIGIFAGFGFYLVLLYRPGSNKYMYIYLGGFCICCFILESIIDVGLIYYLFKDIPFWLIAKLEYLSYMGVIVFMMLFMRSMYKKEVPYKFFKVLISIHTIYTICIVLLPLKIYAYTKFIYITIFAASMLCVFITLIKAMVKKLKFSLLLFIGMCVLTISVIIDILYVNSNVDSYFRYSSYIIGALFFLVCEVYALSVDVDDAFENSTKAKDMEIAFLQAQIAPHFIFNTLNNIYYLMDESVTKAKNLIIYFSDFLRVKHKFDYRKNPFYSLREEIDLINSFIKIQNIRFNNMINLITDIDSQVENALIPQLLIQPIVENSIKHGFCDKNINICIQAVKKNNMVLIIVKDDGIGMSEDVVRRLLEDKYESQGIGLKNINYRLRKCYNTKLMIESEVSKGTIISFEILMEVKDGCSDSGQ